MEERIKRRIVAEPRHEHVLYRILADCQEPIALDALEQKISAYPEMQVPVYEPAVLVSWLVEAGALSVSSDVEEGAGEAASEAAAEAKAGVGAAAQQEEGPSQSSAPEEDGPVVVAITAAGKNVLSARQEEDALGQLLATAGQLRDAFLRALEICRTPQSKKAVEQQLVAEGLLNLDERQVSYFLDKLEKTGALVWDKGWVSTPEGLAKLA